MIGSGKVGDSMLYVISGVIGALLIVVIVIVAALLLIRKRQAKKKMAILNSGTVYACYLTIDTIIIM